MGIKILNRNADYSDRAVGYLSPVEAGLVYLNFFDQTADAGRNLAPNGASGSLVGTPAGGNGYADLVGGTAYVDSNIQETKDATFMIAATWPTRNPADNHMGIASYSSSGDAGQNLYYAGPTDLFAASSERNNSGTLLIQTAVVPGAVNESVWHFLVGRYSDTVLRINDKTFNKDFSASAPIYPRAALSGRTLRIGSSYSSGAGNTTRMHFAAIFNRVLADAEVDAMYTAVQSYAATKSITL